MSIFEWLTQFKDEDSVLGDLVRDALSDPDFREMAISLTSFSTLNIDAYPMRRSKHLKKHTRVTVRPFQ